MPDPLLRLGELVSIPGISASAFPPAEVRRSAHAVAETLLDFGLERVTAIEAIPIANAANQLADAARARLSLRTVRNLGTREAGELWEADPRHPLFAAARRALSRGFGAEAVMIGSGGSIGFVAPFAAIAGGRPPLLTGVQDPRSNAHSENESLALDDWHKAVRGAGYLFDELAEVDA